MTQHFTFECDKCGAILGDTDARFSVQFTKLSGTGEIEQVDLCPSCMGAFRTWVHSVQPK